MSPPHILVVEDERALADLFTEWLTDAYCVDIAYDGEQALELLDESVEVVLLDRRLPDRSGDAVLAEIRERGIDCRVVMVSAVTPDFDVLDMGFDSYLTKPVSEDDLNEVVEQMLARTRYEDQLQEYFALVSKRVTLQATADVGSERPYQDLEVRIADLKRHLDDELAKFSTEDFESVFGSPPPDYEEVS